MKDWRKGEGVGESSIVVGLVGVGGGLGWWGRWVRLRVCGLGLFVCLCVCSDGDGDGDGVGFFWGGGLL